MSKNASIMGVNQSEKGIQTLGNGKYQSFAIDSIKIAERPNVGGESEVLFFNPRDLSSFTKDKMDALAHNIRAEGLQQPPIVRVFVDGDSISRVELIAGERRLRSCRFIYDNNLPCFHEDAPRHKEYKSGTQVLHKGRFGTVVEQTGQMVVIDFEPDAHNKAEQKTCDYADVYPTIPGKQLYQQLPCRVIMDCSDERALRLAFSENDKSEPLTIAEEITLVERLEKMGKRQDEIAEILGSNVPWVSQTANFRRQLPEGAFEKLISGHMARHVAVGFLSYAPEDRKSLFEASLQAEKEETEQKIEEHQILKEKLEDEEELHASEAKVAEQKGDLVKAKKERRKASVLAHKASKEAEKVKRAKKEAGTIKQGHVKKGAATTGIMPKKAKPFDNDDIDATFVKGMVPYLDGGGIDEVTGQEVPPELAAIVRRTALAIIHRNRDPLSPIRGYMQSCGKWAKGDDESDDDDFPTEAFDKSEGAFSLDNEVTDFDSADDDDSLEQENFESSVDDED